MMKQEDESLFEQMRMDADESLTREEALAKVAMILARVENPKIMSELSLPEVSLISALQVYGEIYDFEAIKNFTNNFLQHRVSKDRMGRKEILEIASEVRRLPEKMMGGLRNAIFRRNIQ